MISEMPASERRHVSLLTRDTLALVLAGGQGSRLYELTRWRAKPAVHFGGKARIIDFPLSNCINSGIRRIGVLTQYKAHSLIRHLVRAWTRFHAGTSEFVEILPASQRMGGEWYKGTADAIYQNIDIIRTHNPRMVLILAGDHIYKMDYGPFLAWHSDMEADMSVCCVEVPVEEAAGQLGVMTVDENGRVIAFDEKPEKPNSIPGKPGICLASMGNYVFNTGFLFEQLIKDSDVPDSTHDFGRDLIPSMIENYRVFAYPFRDPETGEQAYWRDVGTLDAFWKANIELTYVNPPLNLYDKHWPIYTHHPQLPPAKIVFNEPGRRGEAVGSMLSAGCIVSGALVENSLLFSNTRVHSYSEISDSVILPECVIKRHAKVRNAIIDKGTVIPEGMRIGYDEEEDLANGLRITKEGHRLVTPDILGQFLHHTR